MQIEFDHLSHLETCKDVLATLIGKCNGDLKYSLDESTRRSAREILNIIHTKGDDKLKELVECNMEEIT